MARACTIKKLVIKNGEAMPPLSQQSLLQTEARIIAEDDTYAVIALRIPKRWISRNLSFFAALADLVLKLRHRARA
jgi:hypothetical protein